MTASDAPGELVIYPGKDGRLRVQARLAVDTLWLSQKQMAELFGVQPPAISKHLKNTFETGELAEAAVVSILESTAAGGKTYATRKEADAIAHAEFEKFAERRRADKEATGAVENLRALESAAKLIESAKPQRERQKKGNP